MILVDIAAFVLLFLMAWQLQRVSRTARRAAEEARQAASRFDHMKALYEKTNRRLAQHVGSYHHQP